MGEWVYGEWKGAGWPTTAPPKTASGSCPSPKVERPHATCLVCATLPVEARVPRMRKAKPVKRLPGWLAGGPEVSDLAYQVVTVGFGDPPQTPPHRAKLEVTCNTTSMVSGLVDLLHTDEADVLRALAELQHAGVIER